MPMILRRFWIKKNPQPGTPMDEDDDSDWPSETEGGKALRYSNSEICEVSDPELWMQMHHGDESDGDTPQAPENERSEIEQRMMQQMRETNEVFLAREHRLEAEWYEAQDRNNLDAMDALELQIAETRGLRYNII